MAKSKIVGNLRVNLGLNSAQFQSGLGRSRAQMGGFAKFARSSAIAVAAGFTVAAGGLAVMTKQGLAFVDQQAKMAKTLDGSINGLRALQIAGEDAGIASGVLGGSMQKLTARLAEAARIGGPAAIALREIGLNAEDLMKLDADQRLAVIADRMKEMGYSAAQAGDIMTQLGVRSKEMSLLMIQGGDAIRDARFEVERFGLAISKDQAAAVEKANDSMSRFGRVFESLRVQLAVNVAPTLERISMRFQSMAIAGGPLQVGIQNLSTAFSGLIDRLASPAFVESAIAIGTSLVNALSAAADGMILLQENANLTAGAMVVLGGAMAFFGAPIVGAITAVAGAMFLLTGNTSQTSAASAELRRIEGELNVALGNTRAGMAGASGVAISLANDRANLARSTLAAAEAELAFMQADLALAPDSFIKDLTAPLFDAAMARKRAGIEELTTALDGAARTVQALTLAQNSFTGSGDMSAGGVPVVPGAVADTPQMESLRELVRVLDPAISQMENYESTVGELNAALAGGLIDQAQFNHYIALADEGFNGLSGSAGGAVSAIDAVGEAAEATGDSIGGVVEETENLFEKAGSGLITGLGSWLKKGEYSLNSFRDFLANQLGRIADMFLDAALKPVAAGFGDLFGGIGQGLFQTPDLSGARAVGGDVKKGRRYKVGEFGEEDFIPDQDGTILPHGSGAQPQLNVSVYTRDPDTQIKMGKSRRQQSSGARRFAGA